MANTLEKFGFLKRKRDEGDNSSEEVASQPRKQPRTPKQSKHSEAGFQEFWLKKYQWLSYESLENGEKGKFLCYFLCY